MPNVSLTAGYDAQLADLKRRQAIAQALQEQANAPLEIQSYKGIQAPIPWTAVLAKALQGGVAGYQQKKLAEQQAGLSQQARQQAVEFLRNMNSQVPNIQATQPMRAEQVQAPLAMPANLQTAAPIFTPATRNAPASVVNPQAMPVQPSATPVLPKTVAVPDMTPRPAMIDRNAADRQQMALEAMVGDNPFIQPMASPLYEQATKDVSKEKMANAIKAVDIGDADPAVMQLYLSSDNPGGAIDYLAKFGMAKQEAAAKLAEIQLRAQETAEQREADRKSREDIARMTIGAQRENALLASADRRAIAAQSSADRLATAQMVQANRRGPIMPQATQTDFVNRAQVLDAADRATSNFKDEFVGHPIVGGAGVLANRITGFNKDAANWWQDYANYQADVIHSRYGGALTKNETDRYRQYAVTPQMNAKVAKANLAEQQKILSTALARRAQGAIQLGYDREAVEALIGRDPLSLSNSPPSSPGQSNSAPAGGEWGKAEKVGR